MARLHTIMAFIVLVLPYCRGRDFYSYDIVDHNGGNVSLEQYRGKATLVVNVASQCGYTESTYQELKKLHDILSYGDYFSVLAFPCNQFGDQEPLDMPEIIEYVTSEFGVEFPIFNKISVVGRNAAPAFKHLIEESSVVPDWNFYKYLVDHEGHVVEAWGTRTTIYEIFNNVQRAVEKAKEAGTSSDDKIEDKVVQGPDGGKDEL